MNRSHHHSDKDTKQLFGIAALAASIGAVTAILFTKQNGAETREALRHKFQEFKAKPQNIKKDIDDAVDSAKDVALKAKDQVTDKTKSQLDAVKHKLDKPDKN